MTTPQQNDITQTACTVAISFGLPRQSRELKEAAKTVEQTAKAVAGTTRVSMYYFRRKEGSKDIDGLASLKKFQGEWKRDLEYYARYPYGAGMRLIPAKLVDSLVKKDSEYKAKSNDVWSNWCDEEYPAWKQSAPDRMGSMYDPEDFPTIQDCKKRFRCEVIISPLAAGSQWKYISAIGGDLTAALEASTNSKIQSAVKEAQASMWSDVLQPIQHIVNTLSKDKPKIYETMLGNVLSIVDLVPSFAFENDPKLLELAEEAKRQLGEITVESLRTSDEARKTTLEKAKALVNAFTPFARKIEV